MCRLLQQSLFGISTRRMTGNPVRCKLHKKTEDWMVQVSGWITVDQGTTVRRACEYIVKTIRDDVMWSGIGWKRTAGGSLR